MSQLKQSGDEGVESPPGRHMPRKNALAPSPTVSRAFPRLHWRGAVALVAAVVGLVLQVVLIRLAWELWELSLSLMELWAELARKHLEITLSR